MAVPNGWRQRAINPNEYEAILIRGQYKYEINVNVDTGQRQIYTITPILNTRQLLTTIDADGSFLSPRTEVYNNVASLPNGQTRIKEIVDSSKIAANEIVGAVGTESQKTKLSTQKEFSSLNNGQASPLQNTSGTSTNNTGNQSGNGGTPVNVGTFAITSAAFNESDKQYKAGFLHYPEKMDPGQDRIVISQVQYEPPDVLTGGNIDFAKINAGGFSNERTFTRNLGTVVLPMPNDISETNVTAWGEDSLSSLAALVGGAALSGVINIAEGKVPEALSEIKSLFATATSQGSAANQAIEQLLTLNAAAALTQKAGINFNAEAFISRTKTEKFWISI
jgi:hypothetical protein